MEPMVFLSFSYGVRSVSCSPGGGDRKVRLKQLEQERDRQLRDKVNKVLCEQVRCQESRGQRRERIKVLNDEAKFDLRGDGQACPS